MSLATRLTNRLNKVLTRFDLSDRAVYKRIITRTGGDPLIGKPSDVDSVDTLLGPQPAVRLLSHRDLFSGTSAMAQVGDYVCTLSASSITTQDLLKKDIVFVFKDKSTNAEETLFLVAFDPAVVNGVPVSFDVVLRSKRR